MKTKSYCSLFNSVLALFVGIHHAAAQGTAFTYQGQLQSGGNPANGDYNMTFSLFNTSSGGSSTFGPVTVNGVVVSNGVFAATIDFGAGAFTGAPSWLQIGVESNGGTSFTLLTPRQPINPVPYAIFATTAGSLTGTVSSGQITGTYNNAVTFNNAADSFSGSFTGNGGGLTNLPAWGLTGNVGTTSGNFLGTTDNQPLQLRVGGSQAGLISPGGGSPNVVFGPTQNAISAGNTGASILGGSNNAIAATSGYSSISGGSANAIQSSSDHSFIGGGLNNTIQAGANLSTVAGGSGNVIGAGASYSFVGGGTSSVIFGGATYSVIGGGNANQIQSGAFQSFLGGGNSSVIAADDAVLGGGANNQIESGANFAVLGGGAENVIWPNATYSFLGSGYANYIQNGATYSAVDGGYFNVVSNNYDAIWGGSMNKVAADYATVPGGANNSASGKYSFAAGQQAQAANQGAFVWADSQNAVFASTNNDSFNVRAQGGVNLVTSGAGLSIDGQHVVAGGGVLTNGESGVSLGNLSLNNLTLSGNMKVPYPFSISAETGFLSSSPFFYMGNNSVYMGLDAGNPNTSDYNVGIGDFVLENDTTGNDNTAMGHAAMLNNTTGFQNTAIGNSAMLNNQGGQENTAVGYSALMNNSSAGGNTAVGIYALEGNTTGGYNTAVGMQSLNGNITGGGNTALGNFALFTSTDGSNNVAVGISAMGNSQNVSGEVAVGYQALQDDISGGGNTAVGLDALLVNTTGDGNTAVGQAALVNNHTGGLNTGVGGYAFSRSTGSGNTAIGSGAGSTLAQGNFNIIIGVNAGFNLTAGENDIYIGNNGVSAETNVIRIGDPVNQSQTYIAGKINGDGSGLTGVVASSLATPPGMAAIPGGAFIIGDTLDHEGDATPAVVNLSPFYMDVNVVTYPVWQSVYFWATNNGYTFDDSGGSFNQWGDYAGFNKPVSGVNWYDCVKWCNARSLQAGLTQVYYLDSNFLFPYFSGDVDVVYANPAANGYRLPTEAEWERAARGGLSGQRFPWGNVINENLANYENNPGAYYYDLGGNTQYAVTAVGVYPPNLYGLYDMAGNVFQWCWDWYAAPSYPPGSPYLGGTNPQGPSAGSGRVIRGCGYEQYANVARCAQRSALTPNYAVSIDAYGGNEVGLRCVRSH